MTNLAQMSKSKRKTEYRNAGKAYSRVIKTAAKDKTPSNVQEDTRKKFIFSYEEILRYFQNDTEVTLDDVSSDFRKLMTDALPYLFSTANGRALSPQEQQGPSPSVEGAIRRGLQQSGESPREEPDGEESGQKVTAAQKSGLMDIARWLLRNMDKHGAAGDSKSAWVRGYVLEQPPRVKLLAYYMVENGASSLTGEAPVSYTHLASARLPVLSLPAR